MAALSPEALVKRAERAEKSRDAFAGIMRDAYKLAMPERDGWNSYGDGQDRAPDVYDGTAIVATTRFANRLQQALFPPFQRWSGLQLPPELAAEEEAQPLQEDLEAATGIVFKHLQASNFDATINEWAHDLCAGTGCMLIENGRTGSKRTRAPLLRFQAIPSSRVAFDEGPFGGVEGVFFSQKLRASLVARTYPDHASLPQPILDAQDADDDAEQDLLQATYYDAKEDTFRFEVLLRATKERFVERTYRTMPWIVTRWTKAPGETHGRGPLLQALPDIRTVNKLMELMLMAGSFQVLPAWTVLDDGVLNPATVRIVPGAMIPVRSNGGAMGESMKPLKGPGEFQVSELLLEKLTTRIRQVLFDDPLPPEVRPGVTATEITERVRRFQADTGAFGRLQADAVVPIMLRVVDILDEAGMFAGDRFAGLMQALRDEAIRVRPTSPLAQAQDNADVHAVMGFLADAAPLGELGMALVRAGIDPDRAGRFLAEKRGVPHSLIPTTRELAAERAAADEKQTEAAVLQSPAAAQVAGALANAAANPPPSEPMR
jgi:hypothetical protein